MRSRTRERTPWSSPCEAPATRTVSDRLPSEPAPPRERWATRWRFALGVVLVALALDEPDSTSGGAAKRRRRARPPARMSEAEPGRKCGKITSMRGVVPGGGAPEHHPLPRVDAGELARRAGADCRDDGVGNLEREMCVELIGIVRQHRARAVPHHAEARAEWPRFGAEPRPPIPSCSCQAS